MQRKALIKLSHFFIMPQQSQVVLTDEQKAEFNQRAQACQVEILEVLKKHSLGMDAVAQVVFGDLKYTAKDTETIETPKTEESILKD